MAAAAAAAAARHVGKLTPATTHFFLCDMQTRFAEIIHKMPQILEYNRRLVEASKIMGIPLVVTEQYPQALGHTVAELNVEQATQKGHVFAKNKFSMVIPEVAAILDAAPERTSVVLFGIEAHVCVLQTALDLLERGLDVHVVADAVSSRSQTARMMAFERLRQSGAFVTTTESILFQLLGHSKHEHFKQVQKLIVELGPDTGLIPNAKF